MVNGLANAAKELADKANADAAEANRLIGLTNTEISKLNTNVNNVRSDLASAETELNSKIETVKTTLTQNYATKTNLSETQLTLNKTITDSVASVKQEMSEKYAVKSDLTTLQGEYNSFKEDTAKKISQQVSSIETIQTNTTEAQKLAGEAYNKAQGAATSATNASSTANSALDKASDATNVANSASQNATNAVANANSAVSAANTAKSNADKAIADVAALTKTVSSQSTKIEQTSSRIDQVASGITEVGNKVDNLQVGGTNLIKNTSNQLQHLERSDWFGLAASDNTRNFNLADYLGRRLTLRVWIQNPNVDAKLQLYFNAPGWKAGSIVKAGQSGYSQLTVNVPATLPTYWNLVLGTSNGVGFSLDYKELKAEIGDFATSWSPAPEDQQSQIDGINNNIANNYYQKTTVDSKLSTAVSGITAQYTQDITTRLGNYYDKSTIDSKLTIDGKGIATYVKSTQSKLDNLQIGGRNLLLKTGVFDTSKLSGVVGDGNKINLSKTIITDANSPSGKAYRINKYKKGTENVYGGCYWVIQKKLVAGKKYTWSAYVRGVGTMNAFGPEQGGGKAVALTSTWTKVSHTFTANNNQYYQFTFYGNTEFDLYLTDLMLEEGNTPSPWSPAPEDFPTLTQYTEVKQLADRISSTVYDSSTGLTTKVNQLAGKYAITALNSAGDILASLNLNANTSTAEINAKLIRLNGSTKMDDAFVNKLVANSILTNKIKATEISGDIIKGGTIQGVKIISNNGSGNVVLNNGRIDMDLTELNRKSVGKFTPSYITMASYINESNLDGSVSFDYTGFVSKIKDDSGIIRERRTQFGSESLSIYPLTSSGDTLNSGIRLYGKYAYLDLNGNKTTKVNGTVSRIVSNPDGNMQIINNDGNIYLNTKNGENPVSNGYKIPYTFADGNMGIRIARIANPTSSGAYLELSNMVGKAWGVSMWASDQRLKSNITSPTQDALDTLNKLQVRQFDWKSDNVHEDFGLIAQEVEQVLPNAVFKVGDYYQIKDSGLIPVLIGAVQKLSNKVNLLENIIYNTKGSNLL